MVSKRKTAGRGESEGLIEAGESCWWVYIVESEAGKLYTGITTDLERRFEEHRQGKKGARFFRFSGASELVYREKATDRATATRREREIKGMRRKRKLELIESAN